MQLKAAVKKEPQAAAVKTAARPPAATAAFKPPVARSKAQAKPKAPAVQPAAEIAAQAAMEVDSRPAAAPLQPSNSLVDRLAGKISQHLLLLVKSSLPSAFETWVLGLFEFAGVGAAMQRHVSLRAKCTFNTKCPEVF